MTHDNRGITPGPADPMAGSTKTGGPTVANLTTAPNLNTIPRLTTILSAPVAGMGRYPVQGWSGALLLGCKGGDIIYTCFKDESGV